MIHSFNQKAQDEIPVSQYSTRQNSLKKNLGIHNLPYKTAHKNTIATGHPAPDFSLFTANGTPFNLYETLTKGPILLTWYVNQGNGCSNGNLGILLDNIDFLKANGITLYILSPEIHKYSCSTLQHINLPVNLLSDTGLHVAQMYGLFDGSMTVDDARFKDKFYQGTCLISSKGKVLFNFLENDLKSTLNLNELIKKSKELKATD